MNQAEFKRSILVDTNALHFIKVYLDVAQEYGLVPYGRERLWAEIEGDFKKEGWPQKPLENLHKGYAGLAYLQRETENEAVILAPSICWIEIFHGLVEGQAYKKMLEVGMPYRMRQRRSDYSRLVRELISTEALENIRLEVENLPKRLEKDLGITIEQPGSESRDLLNVFDLVYDVLSCVYLDVIDALIYTVSLLEQTDALLTFDTYFRDAVYRIHNPGAAPRSEIEEWTRVREGLQEKIRYYFSADPRQPIVVPKAVMWKEIRNLSLRA